MKTPFQICKNCLTPSTRPRVSFVDGVCNACEFNRAKDTVDWESRSRQFLEIIDNLKNNSSSPYHCVVPWSGGKDSSTIAYKLKFEYGLNPLLATFRPMIPNQIGEHNRQALLAKGFDHVSLQTNPHLLRKLAKRFFIERGNPKVAWDAGINAFPVRIAQAYGISAVFYAEHGESEYGGRVLSEEHQRTRDLTEVLENYVGDDPLNWEDEHISSPELCSLCYPEPSLLENTGLRSYYFGYFFRWSMYNNYQFIKEVIDFKVHPRGRTCGTFTSFDSLDDKIDNLYYYMQYIKFGFGRASRDASRLIQNSHMTRSEGIALAKKYDDEFCYDYFDEVLDYLDLTKDEFEEIVDSHRDPRLWSKINGSWTLNTPLASLQ